ncbi:MAG TPA: hypothetical protein VFW50_28835 [Streptosporangiaceae bacterium]|nr:hypothetical protein [Streptosporangiaceae bacterium]
MGSSAAYARAHEAVGRSCRGGLHPRELRLEALAAIRRAVGFDAYAWLVTDPETAVGSSPLADVPCLPRLPQLIRLKYLTAVNRWTTLPGAVASLAQATGGDLSGSLMWRELLREYQVTDIASAVHQDRFGCWGFLDLWRAGAPPFSDEDLGFLAGIAGPLTTALRQGVAGTFTQEGTGAAADATGDQPPAGPSCCCCPRTSRCGRRPRRRSATCGCWSRPRRAWRPSRRAPTTSPRSCSPPRPGRTATRRWPACTWPAAGG